MKKQKKFTAKSFEIAGHKIKVIKKKNLAKDNSNLGEAHYMKNYILLQKADGELAQSQQDLTFYHEKAHIILFTMGREDLSNDEKFVDLLAQLWLQSDMTAKF